MVGRLQLDIVNQLCINGDVYWLLLGTNEYFCSKITIIRYIPLL